MQLQEIPRVSIGLPVYNGEKYLEEALNSILAQTFTDYELVISDNASADRTAEICKDYASGDRRIRYSRNERNIGGANNGNLTFRLSSGKYFRWAAHDDVCAPQLLGKCVEVLDCDPSVVLCHTMIAEIDEKGNYLRTTDTYRASSTCPHFRFRELAALDHQCEQTCGLIRSSVLRKTRLLLNYTDSDRTMLAELSLYGRFHQVPEPLFYRRVHSGMSTQAYSDWRGRMAWFKPGLKDSLVFPHWQQFFHYLYIISRAPLAPYDRLQCYLYMLRWLREKHGRWMIGDARVAVQRIAARMTRTRPRPPERSSRGVDAR